LLFPEHPAAIAALYTTNPARKVTVPLHGSTDLKRGTVRAIIAQAGLTVAKFIGLL